MSVAHKSFVPSHRKNVGKKFNGRAKIDAMYDVTWEKYRARFLAINKECYACGKPSQVVDHLIPHLGNSGLFEKLDNHLPLCIPCHNTLTSKFDRYYRAGNSITPKIQWLSRNRFPRDDWNPKRVKVLDRYRE